MPGVYAKPCALPQVVLEKGPGKHDIPAPDKHK